ncbi:hypothetical protein ECANGB1_1371 [Enterospora canceri]|uniref:Uncharacterized protein n=1 Tax=Enterospora canceri TaxID=1081671 RepID=A0A1Y1S650_9MICR|nr:hypothetical protein ECANGB1_1371 [Enterospora canceri]
MSKKSTTEKAILMYKCANDDIYFYVKWLDNTESWTRLSNLSNKMAIMDFVRNALKLLRTKRKNEEDEKEIEQQKLFKEEMIKKAKLSTTANGKFGKEKQQPMITRQETKEVAVDNRKIVAEEIGNSITLRITESTSIRFTFYWYERFKTFEFQISDCIFIAKSKIVTYARAAIKKSENSIFTFDYSCIGEIEQDFKQYLTENNLAMCLHAKNSIWVFYYPVESDTFLGNVDFKDKGILFRVQQNNKLQAKNFTLGEEIKTRAFVDNSFKAYPLLYETSLFADVDALMQEKLNYGLLTKNTYRGLRLLNLMGKAANITMDINKADTIIVQDIYAGILHQIFCNKFIKNPRRKFYKVEQNGNAIETFKPGGVIIFSKHFIQYGPLDFLIKISNFVNTCTNWTIRTTMTNYNFFKKRLNDMMLDKSEQLKFKFIYRQLKNGVYGDLDCTNEHDLKRIFEATQKDSIQNVLLIGEHDDCAECITPANAALVLNFN